MIAAVRSWLLGVILCSFACSLARSLAPQGREQRMLRLTAALILLLSIVQPMAQIHSLQPAFSIQDLSDRIRRQEESYQRQQDASFSALIEERTKTYIWDKATQLGLDLDVSVELTLSEAGLPVPCYVTLKGPYSPELAAWLERELGLGAADQIWLEGME